MIRVSILGSCVTADAFALEAEPLKAVSYHSRSSLVSLNSPPLAIGNDELQWKSRYARQRVLADFNKTVLPEMYACQPDIVLFDFIDERFDLLRSGESYFTMSNVLIESGFPGALQHVFERIPRDSLEAMNLWKEAAVGVTAQIRHRLPAARLMLHRAWWAKEFLDGKEIVPFSGSERRESAQMNEQLTQYYSYFEERVPGVQRVEVKGPRRASKQHRWGLAPYHYESAYYAELLTQIVEKASA